MDLTIVGCTGSLPGPDSPASCYLVTAEGDGRTWRILLDLGSGAFGALQRHAAPAQIDAVILSHLHPDHCLDLTAMRVWRGHGPDAPEGDLPVWAPPGGGERMARAYGVRGPEELKGMEFRELVDAVPFSFGPFRITAYAVRHPVPAFGLRVESGGRVLAYTGDTDSCPGLGPLMAGADLVLSEASFLEREGVERGVHLTARRAAEAAAEASAGRLMLTHIPPWHDPQESRAEAAQVWPREVELAVPGLVTAV
ncbi:MBL fold metallo-hydrolase [Ornithinimicrobium panacihumi]|uniref:MBL fold metallo-hydrolase n=1 Tax=Ornithinimicrobium panacihumi TaxID=2008449 RepID=UPI003F89149C